MKGSPWISTLAYQQEWVNICLNTNTHCSPCHLTIFIFVLLFLIWPWMCASLRARLNPAAPNRALDSNPLSRSLCQLVLWLYPFSYSFCPLLHLSHDSITDSFHGNLAVPGSYLPDGDMSPKGAGRLNPPPPPINFLKHRHTNIWMLYNVTGKPDMDYQCDKNALTEWTSETDNKRDTRDMSTVLCDFRVFCCMT